METSTFRAPPPLQLLCALADLLIRFQRPAEDLAQLEGIGLDEEGPVGKYGGQEVPGGVHHGQHAPTVQPAENLLIDVIRHGPRDGARQHKDIALCQPVQLPEQRLHSRLRDGGTPSIDLALLPRLDLHVDAGHALLQPDKGGVQAGFAQAIVQGPPGKTSQKAQRGVFDTQIVQHGRNIDALPAELYRLKIRPVQPAGLEIPYADNIIQRRVKGYGIDDDSHLLHFGIIQISLIRQMVSNQTSHFQWKRHSGGHLAELAGVGQDEHLLRAGRSQVLDGS